MIDEGRRAFLKGAGAVAVTGAVAGCASTATKSKAFDAIPRIELTTLPTACNRMENLTSLVGGPDLYIKRDDVMELAHGGNKTRKLEYALAEALNQDARAVVTQGGLQSNHVRQTCSGAAKVGLEAHVILSNPVPEMEAQLKGSGNFLMDQLMGAHIYLAEDGRGPVVEKVIADLTAAGKNPYNIPAGASNGIGGLGYVRAARELIEQWDDMGISPSHIFTATGSCGTQAGLLTGLRYFGNENTKVVGVSISGSSNATSERMRSVLNMIADEMGISRTFINGRDIIVNDQYIGEGYGRPTDAGIAAIRIVAENEGVILDPVYTGKCMSAMLDLLQSDQLPNARDIVFLHTGGAPAIHPYAEYLKV
ncbi:MAG: pyridoxal-phosphate dependent enzyme [Gammaproteobacteria bacterium]|nr:pyridoxal-phosphate dependent enzyme [Gammaproteobacteria bacterium]